jgi:hypothetical protein
MSIICVHQFFGTPSVKCCSKRIVPTRVTQWFISDSQGIGLELSFASPLQANLQNKVIALCPQLHRVVIKHKVLY